MHPPSTTSAHGPVLPSSWQAFAACLLKNLARAGSITLHVTTDESPRRVELVHRNLRNYGTVFNTLAQVCDVHGRLLPVATKP